MRVAIGSPGRPLTRSRTSRCVRSDRRRARCGCSNATRACSFCRRSGGDEAGGRTARRRSPAAGHRAAMLLRSALTSTARLVAATGQRQVDDAERDRRPPGAARGSAGHRRCGRTVSRPEAVADAADGEDELRLARVGARASRAGGGRARRSCAARGSPRRPRRLEQHAGEKTRPGLAASVRSSSNSTYVSCTARRPLHVAPARGRSAARRARSPPRRPAARSESTRGRSSARTRLRNSRIENGFVM